MIKIVDAICGSGKTTWVFEHMRSQPEKRWLFVSPYLDEAGDSNTQGRIQRMLPELQFKSPSDSPSKTESFKRLASLGENIACTHSLFTRFTPEISDILRKQGYHLVIDETIDLVSFYEEDGITTDDIKILIKAGMILPDTDKKLVWNPEYSSYNGRDNRIKQLCDLECLWLYGDDVLIQRIPPTAMKACQSVIVLTYMFEASLMYCWMQLNELAWEYYNPEGILPNSVIKKKIRQHLHIWPIPKNILEMQRTERGLYKHNIFNKGWYDNVATQEDFETVKSSIIYNLRCMSKGNVFWTTFKDYENTLSGKGYKNTKNVGGKSRSPFIPKNIRASNEYKDCNKCIYTVNIYPHGSLKSHINSYGISVDEDMYAVSELIQFLFRGCIREYKDMYILILSERMQMLLEDWLEKDY